MKTRKNRPSTLLITALLGFCAMNTSVFGEAQKEPFKTLKLVNTYQSEVEFQAAYPELFPSKSIRDEGDVINFYDSQTGQLTRQMKKKERAPFTSDEKTRFASHDSSHPVTKTTYGYQFSNDHSFMLYTEYDTRYNTETDVARSFPKRVVLYNAKGEEIAQLPPEVNIIRISPDKQHFLAYGEHEGPSEYLYVYSMDGTLVAKEKMNGYLMARYSQEGEFFPVFDSFGRKFAIFSKTGKKVYENDYTNLKKHTILYGVFVSEDGTSFLLHTSGKLSLFTLDDKLLWEISFPPGPAIYGCRFDSTNRIIIVISRGEKSRVIEGIVTPFQKLQSISLDSGQILDTIKGITYTRLLQETVIIQKEGVYHEYKVQ